MDISLFGWVQRRWPDILPWRRPILGSSWPALLGDGKCLGWGIISRLISRHLTRMTWSGMILVKVSRILKTSLFVNSSLPATTQGGALRIMIEQIADTTTNHNLQYRSAMVCNIWMRSLANFTHCLVHSFSHGMISRKFLYKVHWKPAGTSSALQVVWLKVCKCLKYKCSPIWFEFDLSRYNVTGHK